jgi:hypothetical protein
MKKMVGAGRMAQGVGPEFKPQYWKMTSYNLNFAKSCIYLFKAYSYLELQRLLGWNRSLSMNQNSNLKSASQIDNFIF